MRRTRGFCLALLWTLLAGPPADALDASNYNRRAHIDGLPQWSAAGYERGSRLPSNSNIGRVINVPYNPVDISNDLEAAIACALAVARADVQALC
jgi:hypothetical protein